MTREDASAIHEVDSSYSGISFTEYIDQSIIERSTVLSIIAEAEGKARLPDDVGWPELRLWMTAIELLESSHDSLEFPFIALCRVAKVADVMGDEEQVTWIEQVAQGLAKLLDFHSWARLDRHVDSGRRRLQLKKKMEKASFQEHCGSSNIATAAQGLSMLPDHIQQPVFAAAAKIRGGDLEYECSFLYCLLDVLPSSMHPNLIKPVNNNGVLDVHIHKEYTQLITALASLPASETGLRALNVTGNDQPQPYGAKRIFLGDWAPKLVAALQHHTSITSLSLCKNCVSVDALEDLAPVALPSSLPSIQSLHLSQRDINLPSTSPCHQALRQLLLAAPLLHHLQINMCLDSELRQRKRDRSEGGATTATKASKPGPRTCLLETLAVATALTSLDMKVFSKPELMGGPYEKPTVTRSLPSLSHLVLRTMASGTSSKNSWPLRFLEHLEAPLTTLYMSIIHAVPADQALAPGRHAFSAIARLTTLKAVDLDIVNLQSPAEARSLMSSLLALSHLTSLRVGTVFEPRKPPAMWANAIINALTSLPGAWPEMETLALEVRRSWGLSKLEALVRALCALSALSRLKLMAFFGWDGNVPDDGSECLVLARGAVRELPEAHAAFVAAPAPDGVASHAFMAVSGTSPPLEEIAAAAGVSISFTGPTGVKGLQAFWCRNDMGHVKCGCCSERIAWLCLTGEQQWSGEADKPKQASNGAAAQSVATSLRLIMCRDNIDEDHIRMMLEELPKLHGE